MSVNSRIIPPYISGENAVWQFRLALAVFMSMFKVSLRNWFDPNWRHELTNALIIASVLAIFGVLGTAVYSFMTKSHPPLYAFLVGGAIVGLLIGFIVYLLVSAPKRTETEPPGTPPPEPRASSGKSVEPETNSPVPSPPIKPPTVSELFQNDFPALLKIDSEREFVDGKNNTKTKIKFRLYRDFESKSKFVSFYIPYSASTFDACRVMLEAFQGFLDEAEKVEVGASITGAPAMAWSKDLLFTGKFFVYYESDLTLEEQGQLSALYKSKGFVIEFRGQSYVTARFLQSRAK